MPNMLEEKLASITASIVIIKNNLNQTIDKKEHDLLVEKLDQYENERDELLTLLKIGD